MLTRDEKTAQWGEDLREGWLARYRGEHHDLAAVPFADGAQLLLKKRVPPHVSVEMQGHGTSDFPAVLQDLGTKRLLDHIRALNPPHRRITALVELPDFKPSSTITAQAPPLLPIEGSKIRWGAVEEAGEPIALTSFGRGWGFSREAIVNDDKSGFDAAVREVAEQVVIAEARLVWSFIQQNAGAGPVMADGFNFFDSTNHANETSAAALDESSLASAMGLLRSQTDLQGEPLNLEPRYIVCKPADELVARKAVEAMGMRGELAVLPEARIAADTSFYVLADPALHPAFLRARLGESGPQMVAKPSWELDSMEFKVVVDAGAGAHSWRAAVRVPAP